MRRPLRLLDGCCCAGGGARGYLDAGFEVTGVDRQFYRRYPGPMIVADVLDVLADPRVMRRFDCAHVSPPCQAHSDLQKQSKIDYPDLIAPVRALLDAWGRPYVIENVEGAPLRSPVVLCGTMFPELRVYRHRLFEANFDLAAPAHPAHDELTFTHDKRKRHYGRPLDLATMRVQVTGGGNAPVWAKRAAMGLADTDMTSFELNEAIPPAYARYLGAQLRAAVLAA